VIFCTIVRMPRRNRCVLPELPCHITQRGVDRREVFSSDQDRSTYLRLLQENLNDAAVRVLGYCLMSNHVHLLAVPAKEDSLSVLLRRVHGRYAQYYNARNGRSGHLWQNRFFACMLGPTHLWAALSYVERNPVRAGIVQHAGEYSWSSASAHLAGEDRSGILDMEWWLRERPRNWGELLDSEQGDAESSLRSCTYAGRPFGEKSFVGEMAERFGRYWNRGRPKKETTPGNKEGERESENSARQFPLF
jgi:putative transposase